MKNFKMVLFSILMLVMGGCVMASNNALSVSAAHSQEENDPTLFVQNTGIDVVRIYQDGKKIATVYPGQSQCVRLRNAQSSFNQLSFGFLAGTERWYSTQESFSEGSGWVWNINSNLPTFSEIDFYPADRCDIN